MGDCGCRDYYGDHCGLSRSLRFEEWERYVMIWHDGRFMPLPPMEEFVAVRLTREFEARSTADWNKGAGQILSRMREGQV